MHITCFKEALIEGFANKNPKVISQCIATYTASVA